MDDYKDEKSMFSECEGAYDDLYEGRHRKSGTSRILTEKLIFNKAAVDAGSRIIRSLEMEKEQNRRDFEKLQKKHLRDKKGLLSEIDNYIHRNEELRARIKPDKKRSVWDRVGSSRRDTRDRDESSSRSKHDERWRRTYRDESPSRSYRDDRRSSRSKRDEPRAYRDEPRAYRDEPSRSSRTYRDESPSRYRPSGSSRSHRESTSRDRSPVRDRSRDEPTSRSRSYRDESPRFDEYRRGSQNEDPRYERVERSRDHSPRGSRYIDSDRKRASRDTRHQPRQQPRQDD